MGNPETMPADGQLLTINGATALFSLLGVTCNFALPDLRSMAPDGLTYVICTTGTFP